MLSRDGALRYVALTAAHPSQTGRPLYDRSPQSHPKMLNSDSSDSSKTALHALLRPESIAIIGATGDSNKLNGRPFHYLRRDGYTGRIYPVNPKYDELDGIPCFPDVDSLPETPDLAIIIVAARRVIATVEALGRKGVPVAVIFSAGFGEMGEEGQRLESELLETARKNGIRICGPNNLGLINAFEGMTATFSQYAYEPPVTGPVAFASQSGAFGTGIAALARSQGAGFGYFVNTGNEADITLTEVLEELLDDDRIKVAAAYLEGLKNPESLLRLAAKSIQLNKPLVVTKVGRNEAGVRAAASHTGALAGEDAVFDAVARQHGIVRANNEQHLLDLVSAFSTCRIPEGRGVAIITQSGGAAALMADRAEELGLDVPVLSENTQARLREVIPPFGMPGNPVDLTAQFIAEPDILTRSVTIALEDPAVHAAVIWFQLMHGFVDELVEVLIELKRTVTKPFVVCWLAAPPGALDRIRDEGICVIGATEPAIDIISGMASYGEARQRLLEEPRPIELAHVVMDDNLPVPVPSLHARNMLVKADMPLVAAELASNGEEAAALGAKLGWPIALKIESPDILHKSDAGGVQLGLTTEEEVRSATDEILASAAQHSPNAHIDGVLVQPMAAPGTELVLGMRRDPIFGPIIMFGLGGVFIETLKDVAFGRAPLTKSDVSQMIATLKCKALLDGARGLPSVNQEVLSDALIALSYFAVDHPEISEVDLNPVFANADGLIAVDWMVLSTEKR